MEMCIDLASKNVATGGGPFGALVVRGGELIATGTNVVTSQNDPTAHAEVQAIRAACRAVGDFRLTGYELYASAEPCPMCLAASYWSRVDAVYYAACRQDAARAGFDDERLYEEMALAHDARSIRVERLLGDQGNLPFDAWRAHASKIPY